MPDESAFLDALRADPLDAATRGVYCDWLEERGDPRAEYPRNEIELAGIAINDPRWPALAGWVRDRMDMQDRAWVGVACPRYDVWLNAFEPDRKISTIKAILPLVLCGLAGGKRYADLAPSRVLTGVVFPIALFAAAHLLGGAALRPNGGNTALWPTPSLPDGQVDGWPAHLPLGRFEVMLDLSAEPSEVVVAAVGRLTGAGADGARWLARGGTFSPVKQCRTRAEAAAAAAELSAVAPATVREASDFGDPAHDLPLALWQGHTLERPG